jgi:predicted nucleic-acid-binding protein
MIGLDTNILVRYFTHDQPAQTTLVLEFMDSLTPAKPGFISLLVLVELVWVLERFFRTTRLEVAESLETLMRSKEIVVERSEIAWQALRTFQASNSGFADCLVECCGRAADCEYTLTLDQRGSKTTGMRLLR